MKPGIVDLDGRSVTGLQSMQVKYNIYSKILRWVIENDQLKLVGDLAAKWGYENGDNTKLTVHINKDATFQNGDPVTAQDVKYTFDSMLAKPSIFSAASSYPNGITVTPRDDKTVVFDTGDSPMGSLEAKLGYDVGIVPEKLGKNGSHDLSKKPVGSGPFQLVEWAEGDHVTVKRYADYWKKDSNGIQLPYLDGIKFKIYPTSNTKLQELKSGGLDWIDLVLPKDVSSVKKDNSLVTSETGPGGQIGVFEFNIHKPPFNDIHNRRAALHAMDWNAVINVVFSGTAKLSNGQPIPPQLGWQVDIKDPYKGQDLDKAKAELKKSSVDHTATFTNVASRGDETELQVQQVLQQNLGKVGFDMKINKVDPANWFKKLSDGDFGFFHSYIQGLYDPDQMLSTSMAKGSFFNFAKYHPPDITKLLKQGVGSTKKDDRKATYKKLYQKSMDDAAEYFPYWQNIVFAMKPEVQDFMPILSQNWFFETTWKKQS